MAPSTNYITAHCFMIPNEVVGWDQRCEFGRFLKTSTLYHPDITQTFDSYPDDIWIKHQNLSNWDSLEGGGDGGGGHGDVVAGVVWVAHAAHQAGPEVRPHLVSLVANWSG